MLLSYCLSSPVQYLYSNVWKQQRTQVIARAEAYPLKSTGNIWRFALRLAGAAGARKHSCRSVREPREPPPLRLSRPFPHTPMYLAWGKAR